MEKTNYLIPTLVPSLKFVIHMHIVKCVSLWTLEEKGGTLLTQNKPRKAAAEQILLRGEPLAFNESRARPIKERSV